MTLNEALARIRPLDPGAMRETKRRLDSIIHPIGGFGKLEDHLIRIAGITGRSDFDFAKKAAVIFCGDHGVARKGVTQAPLAVTAVVAEALTTGDACVSSMARVAGADVIAIDVGIASDLEIPGLIRRKVAYGTKDFTEEPAMTREQAVQALEAGIRVAEELKASGYGLLATGEMGVGNTTCAAALSAAMLSLPAEQVTGRGAGLSDEGLRRKLGAVKAALALHRPDPDDALDLLSKIGGFEVAGMAGLCVGGAAVGLPVALDGVTSCAAAALAVKLHPLVREYLLPSHTSAEPAGRLLLEWLGLSPPLEAGMRVGEGTGAVASFPLYDMINAVYSRMVRFEDKGVAQYKEHV